MITITVVLLGGAPVAGVAKRLPRGPVAVMTPNGSVLVLKGRESRIFVRDANSLQCNRSCDSPQAAARVAEGPGSGATSHRYLVAFTGWGGGSGFNWTAAAWFYPSTKEEPAYLVWPIGIGDERGAWAEWQDATPRMERIILGAKTSAQSGLPLTGGPLPVGLLVGVAIALAGAGVLLLGVSRGRTLVRRRRLA